MDMPATNLVSAIRAKRVSPRAVIDAVLAQIDRYASLHAPPEERLECAVRLVLAACAEAACVQTGEEGAHVKRRYLADLGLQSSQTPGIGSERRLGAPGDALVQQECLNDLLQGASRGFLRGL